MDVVVPVFNAALELADCLDSLLHHTPVQTRVWIINDASTDPGINELLADYEKSAPGHWRFLQNDRNLGFVATANRGMALAGGDVVLLNSDTLVTAGWIQGLLRCLQSDPAIATATPWTNNGEIVSFPKFCQANPMPAELDRLAEIIAQAGRPEYPRIPTSVGFCMAVSRQAIEKIGYFDERQFGRGYGEENDFSMRASKAGFVNVLCDDVFVAHHGGSSFGPLGLKPGDESMSRLLERHPEYLATVQSFIEADPIAERRRHLIAACQQHSLSLG